jgi:predicted lipoprotein with Yx(FWY)xxD motif
MTAMSGVAGLSLAAAACSAGVGYGAGKGPGAQAPPGVAAQPATTVALGSTNRGEFLVDGRGRTLYLFEADAHGTSACVSPACVAEWPPLTAVGALSASGGLVAAGLGTTSRPDGTHQVTYDGHPLYRFAGDVQAGTANGQGLDDNGGLWYPVRTDGTAALG